MIICSLWLYSSCEEEENKLPGTKPEMLFGKWENVDTLSDGLPWFGSLGIAGYRWRTYEFTEKGGSLTQLDYIIEEDRYKEPFIRVFTNWSYNGETIYFENIDGRNESHWGISIKEMTPDSIKLGSIYNTYYKIKL
jgi:hypothetical protein